MADRPVEMWWHTRRNQISSFDETDRVHLNRRWRQFSRLLAAEVWGISGSNAVYTMFRGSVKGTGYPTPFASFPFTSLPVCYRAPSHFNWSLTPNAVLTAATLSMPARLYYCIVVFPQDKQTWFTQLRPLLQNHTRNELVDLMLTWLPHFTLHCLKKVYLRVKKSTETVLNKSKIKNSRWH